MRSYTQYWKSLSVFLFLAVGQIEGIEISGIDNGLGAMVRLERGQTRDSALSVLSSVINVVDGIISDVVSGEFVGGIITDISSGNEHLIAFSNDFVQSGTLLSLLSLPSVAAAEFIQNYGGNAPIRERRQGGSNWHLDRINQRSNTQDGNANIAAGGAGVRIFVVDSGVDIAHPAFVGADGQSRAEHFYNAFDMNGEGPEDTYGHGTHVAGLAAGVGYGAAVQAKVSSVKVLDKDGRGTTWSVLEGLNRILNVALQSPTTEMRIAVLSLSGPLSPMVDAMVVQLYLANVLVVVSAGNNGGQNACSFSPAGNFAAITVGATGQDDRIASFSNRGMCVDILAPGVGVYSTLNGGGVGPMEGTSMSAPLVAGVAASLWSQATSMGARQVRTKVLMDSTSLTLARNGNDKDTTDRFLFSELKVVGALSADFEPTRAGLLRWNSAAISNNDLAVSAGFYADIGGTNADAWIQVRTARSSNIAFDDPMSTRPAQSYVIQDGQKEVRIYAGGPVVKVFPSGTTSTYVLVASLLSSITGLVDSIIGAPNAQNIQVFLNAIGLSDVSDLFVYDSSNAYGIVKGALMPATDQEFNADRWKMYRG
ncbi:hypothetical protein SARC_11127 [Sphaeroforma arctica JP610]|uniref:Peptidase S8/S53 domain-containing protein n=1 Tax=Sphaeroforma arctica JP610 TaxID=667725 RepID=A0A0L0FHY1_9EUKA|nr:hypothetical protein SARC_11127 [Sphaeroforma arctica JP610]KNC76370.1 hypothetical protein SARC_11127 [Sphaeroforma arctica JP610]|eukprot:XP_014150272.1 hypothetical protein SARC_11127 [Sphaeroforma arctica JP610]